MAAKKKKHEPELAKLYAEVKRTFTAADLQKFTQVTPTIPLKHVILELEGIYQRNQTGRKAKKASTKHQNGTKRRKKSA